MLRKRAKWVVALNRAPLFLPPNLGGDKEGGQFVEVTTVPECTYF